MAHWLLLYSSHHDSDQIASGCCGVCVPHSAISCVRSETISGLFGPHTSGTEQMLSKHLWDEWTEGGFKKQPYDNGQQCQPDPCSSLLLLSLLIVLALQTQHGWHSIRYLVYPQVSEAGRDIP